MWLHFSVSTPCPRVKRKMQSSYTNDRKEFKIKFLLLGLPGYVISFSLCVLSLVIAIIDIPTKFKPVKADLPDHKRDDGRHRVPQFKRFLFLTTNLQKPKFCSTQQSQISNVYRYTHGLNVFKISAYRY